MQSKYIPHLYSNTLNSIKYVVRLMLVMHILLIKLLE